MQRIGGPQYDGMVKKALEQLTRWAFPDSQIERPGDGVWQLWHTTDAGEKYIDVTVTLQVDKNGPSGFSCEGTLAEFEDAELTFEDLESALRRSIFS